MNELYQSYEYDASPDAPRYDGGFDVDEIDQPAITDNNTYPHEADDTAEGSSTDRIYYKEQASHPNPVIAAMDRLGITELLGSPEAREELLRNADFEAVKTVLDAVNGTVRGLPPEEWGQTGRSQAQREASLVDAGGKEYDPPEPADRVPLLKEVFETAQALPADYAATLLGLGTNATHSYDDGSGRTSRFVGVAIGHGYDGSPQDSELYDRILTETEGRAVVDFNPHKMRLAEKFAHRRLRELLDPGAPDAEMPSHMVNGYDYMAMPDEYGPGCINLPPGAPAETKQALHDVISDEAMGMAAVALHISRSGGTVADYIKTNSTDWGDLTYFDLENVLGAATPEYIAGLSAAHRDLRQEYIRDLTNIFTNPERADEAQRIVDFYRPANP